MYATQTLPDNCRKLCDIDLEKNKKQYAIVNVLSLVLALIVLVPVWLLAPEGAEFVHELSSLLLLLAGMIGYIFLHEAVHGVCFWAYSKQKPHFGWKNVYAYAASDCYYRKGPYLVIGLAPVVLWGVVLALMAVLLPVEWYWPVQLIQIINLSGAAGDLYVTWLLSRMPKDIWVTDSGISMQVYVEE